MRNGKLAIGGSALLGLVAALGLGSVHIVRADAAGLSAPLPYLWVSPTGAVCTGGNAEGPTVLVARQSRLPGYSPPLSIASVLSHVYVGTTCTMSDSAVRTPDQTVTDSTSPLHSCPRTSAYWISGANEYACGGSVSSLSVSYGATDDYSQASIGHSANEENGYGHWTSVTMTLYDNNSTTFSQFGAKGFRYYNMDGAGFYSALVDDGGTGDFQAFCPGAGFPPNPISIIICSLTSELNEDIHVGLRATNNTTYGGAGVQCWSGDYNPETLSHSARWCTSP